MWGTIDWYILLGIVLLAVITGYPILHRSVVRLLLKTRLKFRKLLLGLNGSRRRKIGLGHTSACLDCPFANQEGYEVVQTQSNVQHLEQETTKKEREPMQESQDFQENQE